jgi:hypothetical protein
VSPFFVPRSGLRRKSGARSSSRPNAADPIALPTRRPAVIDHTQAGYGSRLFVMASACFAPPQTRWLFWLM